MEHKLHAILARARHYASLIAEHGVDALTRQQAKQAAMLIPHLLAHIDAQSSMLGNPRNRRDTNGRNQDRQSPLTEPPTYNPPGRTNDTERPAQD